MRTRARTCARTNARAHMHRRTRTRAHTCAHARACARAHTHTRTHTLGTAEQEQKADEKRLLKLLRTCRAIPGVFHIVGTVKIACTPAPWSRGAGQTILPTAPKRADPSKYGVRSKVWPVIAQPITCARAHENAHARTQARARAHRRQHLKSGRDPRAPWR